MGLTGRYFAFGSALVAFGAAVAYLSYFILFSVTFAALGIACVILGAATITLPEEPVPRRAVRAVIHSAVLNVEALLEEFDAKERATFMPPREGLTVAYVPLSSNPHLPSANALAEAPRRLVTEVEGVPVLMVVPPGSELAGANDVSAGQGLEDALQYVLVEISELCSSVKAALTEDRLVVEIGGIKVKTEAAKYLLCMGSIPTSVAATVASTVMKKQVSLLSEEMNNKSSLATFRVS